MSLFNSLNICSEALKERIATIGFNTPTPVQEATIPNILLGKDVLAFSSTGSGKTAAFIIPLMDKLLNAQTLDAATQALVLVPTRELALQVAQFYNTLRGDLLAACAVIYGGVPYTEQEEQLQQTPNVIIATPGRLLDFIERGQANISSINYLVLDEVDQMLDMGFREPIYSIAEMRTKACQTICFSATQDTTTQELLIPLMHTPTIVNLLPERYELDNIDQQVYVVERAMMSQLMFHLIRKENPEQAIVFTRSRKMADLFAKELTTAGFPTEALHSDRSQAAREYILQRFRDGETRIIVATDVMARGIDIDNVSHVFNYGLPQMTELYTHRIGRTGRNGRSGIAISLCELEELNLLSAICKYLKKNIPIQLNHPFATLAVTRALMGSAGPQKGKGKSKKKKR
ncbi:MAG: DEAD/DEAH box helicase [Marinifilaceae bacterium]